MKTNSDFRLLSALAAIFVVLGQPVCGAAAELSLKPAVKTLVNDVLAAVSAETVQNPRLAEQTLARLAEQVDADLAAAASRLEGEDLNAKVIHIAVQRKSSPATFKTIFDHYITNALKNKKNWSPDQIAPMVIATPDRLPEHLAEPFRPAWEFYAMMRRIPNAPKYFRFDAVEVLVRIGDPRSTIVLEYMYTSLAGDPRAEPYELNKMLGQFPSQQSLRALLSGIAAWQKREARGVRKPANVIPPLGGPIEPETAIEHAVKVFESIRDTAPEKAVAWRTVLGNFGTSSLTGEQKVILRKITEALKK